MENFAYEKKSNTLSIAFSREKGSKELTSTLITDPPSIVRNNDAMIEVICANLNSPPLPNTLDSIFDDIQ